jgi:hypothetical protein
MRVTAVPVRPRLATQPGARRRLFGHQSAGRHGAVEPPEPVQGQADGDIKQHGAKIKGVVGR